MTTRLIATTCEKCKETVKLDLGDASYQKALRLANDLDKTPMSCPGGYHVELGGWKKRWGLEKAIEDAYTAVEKGFINLVQSRFRLIIGKSEFQFTSPEGVSQFLEGYAKGLTLANKPLSKVVRLEKLNLYGELVSMVEESVEDLLQPAIAMKL